MRKRNHKEISIFLRKAFLRVLPVQIVSLVVGAINTFVDSIITGQFLGTEAMAAIGFFVPVTTVIGVTFVVSIGVQILCGRHLGAGAEEKVVSLFSTLVVFLVAVAIGISMLCLLFQEPLAYMLGARGHTALLLTQYIQGYAPGIIGQVLSAVMIDFLPFNNDIRRSYFGIGVMLVSNLIMDILAVVVFHGGVFGMGAATSVSFLLSTFVIFSGFLSRDRAVRFRFGGFCFRQIPTAVRLGLPNLMFTAGCTIKAYVMNLTLMSSVGDAAVAAMNVQNNLCAILGSIPFGCSSAFLLLGSIYYGEEDREALTDLMRYALKIGFLLSAAGMLILMLGSGFIPSFFFPVTDPAWDVTHRMLLLFPCYLVFNTSYLLLIHAYQIQGRMTLANVLSFLESFFMAIFSASMIGILGSDAVWLSFPFSDILSLLIIGVSVMLFAGRLTFQIQDWMKLPPGFGASEEEYVEFSIHSMDEVINSSKTVMSFCRSREQDERRSIVAGLCVEEMAGNVIEHGFLPGEKHSLDIRVVAKDKLTIRLRDDCPSFNPKKRLEQYTPQDPTKNIGIRLIVHMAEEMNYQNSAGINTLLIKV